MAKSKKDSLDEEVSTYGFYNVRRGLLPQRGYWCEHPLIAVTNYISDMRLAKNLDKKLFTVERLDNKDTGE